MRRLLLAATLPLAACGHAAGAPGVPARGSGPARSFAVADFTGNELTGSDDVRVSTGASFVVRAEGDPGVLDRLSIAREGAMLRVGRSPRFTFGTGPNVTIFVTMPRITDARLSGSGDLAIDRVNGDRFSAATSGSGDVSVRAVRVRALDLSISGSGDMAVAGEARALTLDVSGSGDVDARQLRVADATVAVSGSGDVTANVTGAAKVSLVGSGDVDLGNAARCQVSATGSGSVHCGR